MDTQNRHEQVVASDVNSLTCYVGIDVSNARLDVAVRPSGEVWQIICDEAGIAAW